MSMRIVIVKHLMLLTTLFAVACKNKRGAEKENGANHQENVFKASTQGRLAGSASFYKRLEGTVGGKQVVVHFSRFKDFFLANYYYKEHGRPIQLYFRPDAVLEGDSIELIEYEPTRKYEYEDEREIKWHFTFTETGARGKWISRDGNTTHEIALKESYPGGSYIFNAIGFEDSVLIPFRKDTLTARSKEMMLEPADASLAAPWFKNALLAAIWGDSSQASSLTLTQLLEKNTKDFLKDFKEDVDTLLANFEPGDSSMYRVLHYDNLMNANLMYNDNNFIVMDVGVYTYTGGAHGLQGSSIICYDVNKKNEMNLQDILKIDSATLQPIVEKNFRIQNKMRPNARLDQILFENKLPANNNFYFTHKGIGFVYQPYEAAAYVYGILNVFVPFTDLKPYINPAFAQRMNIE